ncbi:MAG: nuclear transport factor 2 family protein [Rhizomicrobium sp.]
MSDEAAIREILNDETRALHAKDVVAAAQHQADDIVSFGLAPPLLHRGADPQGTKAWFATWKTPIGWDYSAVVVAASGDVAFATSLLHITGTKVDGEAIDIWCRSTHCLRKIGGQWKIVNAHISVPFYMDGSYKAAVDLKP